MPKVISDNYSNHNLPIGAVVERLDTSDAPDWSDDGVEWYTQGIEGDEVAIDSRDLEPESFIDSHIIFVSVP